MIKYISLLILLGLSIRSFSQSRDPVHLEYHVKKTAGKTIAIHIIASMDAGWHIYSQAQPPEAIAVPTKLSFAKNPLLQLNGPVSESGNKEIYKDKSTGIIQYQYAGRVEFVQTATLKPPAKTKLNGSIIYQACTGEHCLPPKTVDFSIPVH